MSVVESGENWAIRRGFVPIDLAIKAGEQALALRNRSETFVTEFAPEHQAWDSRRLSVVAIKASALEASLLTGDAQALLDVYRRTEGLAGNGLDEFFLNYYPNGGTTLPHRDAYKGAPATVAVGLTGMAQAGIEDPVTKEWSIIILHPGDALCLDNIPNEAERPLHVVRNALARPRVALVNG